MIAWLVVASLLGHGGTSPDAAKDHHATRFDSRIEVRTGGSLLVTETIVFSFTDGTFTQVFRTIPTRNTDGVEFVSAAMDGNVLPQGQGPGRVQVSRKDGLRVEWTFAPTSGRSHTFVLTYLARGVVKQAQGTDLLEWRVLPRDHDYRIDTTNVEVVAPDAPVSAPGIETRRVDGIAEVTVRDGTVAARAASIRRDGSLIVSVPYTGGSVLDGPPAWQARQLVHRKQMPAWLTAAGVLMVSVLVLLFALRQNYDPPPRNPGVRWESMIPPDQLPPALAGALVANGQPRLEHAMATLFSLAERGVVSIREDSKGMFGQRVFTIEMQRRGAPLAPHEEVALDIIFTGQASANATVSLSKARSHLTHRLSRFKAAVLRELGEGQMVDATRRASRSRFLKTGAVLLGLAGVAVIPCAVFAAAYGGGPFFLPMALAAVGVVSLIVAASLTPLSNEGVRRAEVWRAFRKHLANPQGIEPRWGASGTGESRILPFAVALGLAAAWSKFMKKRNAQTPGWFHAASDIDSGHAFAALLASGGAGAQGHGGGGHGGGGAAGGGASGAH